MRYVLAFLALTSMAHAAQKSFSAPRPATQAEIALIQTGLAQRMKDAGGAKLENVRVVEEINASELNQIFCGTANGNSGGGHGGFAKFQGTITRPFPQWDAFAIVLGFGDSDFDPRFCQDFGM